MPLRLQLLTEKRGGRSGEGRVAERGAAALPAPSHPARAAPEVLQVKRAPTVNSVPSAVVGQCRAGWEKPRCCPVEPGLGNFPKSVLSRGPTFI